MTSASPGRRLALSLLATVIGWAAAYAYFVSSQYLADGRVTDVAAILFWPAVFVALGWILFVAPVVLLVPPTSLVFRPSVAWLFGGVAGVAAFMALLSWWTPFWKSAWYLAFPFIVGAVGCTVYSMRVTKVGISGPAA
jgi:hypothetical protein